MATVVLIKNPFNPQKDAEKIIVTGRNQTVLSWLEGHFEGFKEFGQPTVCVFNGQPLLRKHWRKTRIKKDDIIAFQPVTGSGWEILWYVVVALVAVGVTMAMAPKMVPPNTNGVPEGDPVFTLKGQYNQVRLGQPIEIIYGAPRIWPSYAAAPYNQYRDNEQWLYQIFCIGLGEFDIGELRIEDTPVSSFPDIEVEICPPGVDVTLFPISVVTAPEVNGIELFAPNEPEGDGEWIVDSPGDPEAEPPIPEEGHYAYSMAGPFIVNAPNTEANTIECDVVFPGGLFKQVGKELHHIGVTIRFEMRLIDNSGAPLGDWEIMNDFMRHLNTNTPQRFTVARVVPWGRYEVRASRITPKDLEASSANQVIWETLRAFLNSDQNWPAITKIAVKARASNNLNDNSAKRFNLVDTTRKIPVWDPELNGGDGGWTEPQATRSIAWAFADAARSQNYGGRDVFPLAIPDLLALDTIWEAAGWHFDWVFDQKTTFWEVCRAIAQAGQAVPMFNGPLLTMVRDAEQTLPKFIFNPENIVKGSFQWDIKLWDEDPYDGVRVTYIDPTTYKEETVLCCLDDEEGDFPEEITLVGVQDRDHAFALGLYRRRVQRYVRENFSFTTGLEGNIPSYGDLITVNHYITRYGYSGRILSEERDYLPEISPTAITLTLKLSEPIEIPAGETLSSCRFLARSRQGGALGPFTPVDIPDPKTIIINTTTAFWQDFAYDGSEVVPHFQFGKATLCGRLARVVGIAPAENDTVQLSTVNYDSRVFTGGAEPAPLPALPSAPTPPDAPILRGLRVMRVANAVNEVVATWLATFGARSYQVQYSTTGGGDENWRTIADNYTALSLRFTVQPGLAYVRARAVNVRPGPWRYWVDQAPIDDNNVVTAPPGVTPDTVTGVVVTPQFGGFWLEWTNPTNVAIKQILVYIAGTSTKPAEPTHFVAPTQNWLAVTGLADNSTKYIWIVVEAVNGLYSADQAGAPTTVTTTNGISLDHLIPGGLQPVEIKTSLPSTGNYQGRLVFITSDDSGPPIRPKDKVYRWTDPVVTTGKTYWTANVPSVDITGQLTDSQIADVAAAKLTGQITNTQISDNAISTGKLQAGSISTAKIAAGAITAGEIAAGAITTAKLDVGAVQANNIAANAITSSKIDADAITSGKIQAGAITATAVGANEIITYAANIADATITSAKITSLTADKISAGTITATITINAPTISGGSINGALITVTSSLGMRYTTDTGVYTITGGSGNGIQYGAQIDLQGKDFGSFGLGGVLQFQAGNGTNGSILFRTNYDYTDISGAQVGLLRMTIQRAGDVVIANNASAASFNATSARRFKREVSPLENALEMVEKLQGVSFVWEDRKGFAKAGRADIGFIAEEVEQVIPQVVHHDSHTDEVMGLDYGKITSVLVEAVKNLARRVKELENGQ